MKKEEMEKRRNDIIKHLTGHFTQKQVDEQTNPTVKRLISELKEIDKQLYR